MRRSFLLWLISGLFFSCGRSYGDPTAWQEKKDLLVNHIADRYNPPSLQIGDPEKYYWPRVIARLERYGTGDSLANAWLEALKERSPFHFTLVGMARIMSLYPDAPFIKENKELLLRKVFDRSDSYNAWTAEGTENHINMSRTSGYLFAQHALDFPGEFPDAPEKLALMKQWIQGWSKQIYQTGTGEWNSSIYEVYNLVGWLNLYDFARDPEIRAIAHAVLEAYALEMALHNSWGITGGSEMRGVGVNLDARSATAFYYWLWFSENPQPVNGFAGSGYIQAIHAVTSSYRPHRTIVDLARQKFVKGGYYHGCKPSYNFEQPSFVRQTFYVDRLFTMGNCINNYGGFTGAGYQMVPWKVVVKDTLPRVISGNGLFYNDRSGKTRNPFTQTAQYKNVIIQLTSVPAQVNQIVDRVDSIGEWWARRTMADLQLRFPSELYKLSEKVVNLPNNRNFQNGSYLTLPLTEKRSYADGSYWFRYPGVQIQVSSLNPQRDTLYFNKDRMILETFEAHDRICGFVVEVTELSEGNTPKGTLVKTGDKVEYVTGDGTVLEMQYAREGSYMEPMVDWGFGPVTPQLFLTSPPYFQPQWESGYGYGRTPQLRINGSDESLNAGSPVYSGPGIHWEKGTIRVRNETATYEIDYNNELPEFRFRPGSQPVNDSADVWIADGC